MNLLRMPRWSDIKDRDHHYRAEVTSVSPWRVRRDPDGEELDAAGFLPGVTVGTWVWVAAVGHGSAKRLVIVAVSA